MSGIGLFHQLAPAYFTVTVNQTTIDVWKRHGGRTTFSARNSKTTDPYKLVPAINIVDGLTGLSTLADHSPGLPPLKPDASCCRLPVLVFCGIDDDGLNVEDDEFLGKPLERGQDCIIFSERWISDSLSDGRLMNMADYAKHAPIGWDIDDQSLYLPCPFPPVYHSVLNPRLVTPGKADQTRTWNTGRRDIHSLPVLGPYFDSAHTPCNEFSDSRVKLPQQPHRTSQMTGDSQWHSPTPFRAFGLASPLVIHPLDSPRREGSDAEQDHVPTGFPNQGLHILQSQGDSSDRKDRSETRTELLERYITQKKQTYLHYLQQRADVLRRREKDARDCVEEQIVEIELADSGRSTLPPDPCTAHRHNDTSWPKEERDDPEPSAIASPLELEASTLLELLPPLRRSAEETTAEFDSKHCVRIPRYYPYLAPKLPEPTKEHWRTGDSAEDIFDGGESQREESPHNETSQTRVVAFHNADYGMGYVDFEACADWICLPKRSKA